MNDVAFQTAFKVTSWFECGDRPFTSPAGNFDGMGLSWGPRQNNFGQGTLQPLLAQIIKSSPGMVSSVFGPLYVEFQRILGIQDRRTQLAAVIEKMNDGGNRLRKEWVTAFCSLGNNPVMQQIFREDAKSILPQVEELSNWMTSGSPTVRSVCLAYDIVTQNGSVALPLRTALTVAKPILAPFSKDPGRDWLRLLAWARACWTYIRGNAEFAIDVLGRKLLIIEGHGKFRGGYVDLDAKFGITDGDAR